MKNSPDHVIIDNLSFNLGSQKERQKPLERQVSDPQRFAAWCDQEVKAGRMTDQERTALVQKVAMLAPLTRIQCTRAALGIATSPQQ